MNENPSNNRFDRLEERWQRRQERHAWSGRGTWFGGAALILIGLLLLSQNMKLITFENWWALFIFLPAFGSFGTAWRIVQESDGHFTTRARGAAILGLLLTLVAAMFLFNLNWTIFGPGLLILAGLGLLVNAMLPQ